MRQNKRELKQIRPISATMNLIGPGSCLWMQGETHTLVNVSRFKTLPLIADSLRTDSNVKYRYVMCNFSVDDKITGKPFAQRRSLEISKVCAHIFENLIFLNEYPKQKFYICSDVVYADGSTRAAAINATTVCLAVSGLKMKGYATAVSFGKYNDQMLIDLDGKQDKQGDADCVVTFSKPDNNIVMIQMEGYLTKQEFFQGLDLAEQSCEEIYTIQKRIIEQNEI